MDTTGSKLTAQRGHSIKPGFPRFPQVVGTTLPIAVDGGAASQQNTINVTTLAFSLQRDNDSLLDVRLTTPAALLDSGLLVGATPATAEQADAPLRLAGFRTVSSKDIE